MRHPAACVNRHGSTAVPSPEAVILVAMTPSVLRLGTPPRSRPLRRHGTIRRVELRDPSVELRDAFLRMAEAFRAAGEARHREVLSLDTGGFAAYVARLASAERGEGLPRGQVPERSFWAVDATGEMTGVSRLRPRLDAFHERLAGHIGFEVAPSHRDLETGRRLLELTFGKARDSGLSALVLCCDPENRYRCEVIEAAGGNLLDEVRGLLPEGDAYRKVRYRVSL